ncbi:MAG: Fe-S cluster assembly protein SufD [Armatimonadetes bacterium]|nr:Fe-S cluster assembly protein SufD [Armatimonadota bacterium]
MMVSLERNSDPFVAGYADIKSLLDIEGPAWFGPLREQAIRTYQEFGLPNRHDEEFKYTSLRALEEKKFRFGFGANTQREDLADFTLGQIDAITVSFVNGQYAPEISTHDHLPKGVFAGPISELPDDLSEAVEAHFGKIATLQGKLGSTNDERFVALNTAYLGDIAVVHIAKSVTCEKPIHLQFITADREEGVFSAPRSLVILGENAEAKVIESYVTLDGFGFTCPVTEVRLDRSARLEHTRYQDESLETIHVANTYVHQESQSVYTSNNVNFGGEVARNDINAYVNGEYAETWLNSANVGVGAQVIDNHTRIDHAMPNCQSFEVYKSILKDKAEGVFNGKIFVYEDAQKTDAKQTNQAILLSPTATMNTKPQLEIFADDVKCTHGATIGQLREDALFYLRARGVEKSKAQALLVYAFAAEVLEKIEIDSVREALEARLFDKLA